MVKRSSVQLKLLLGATVLHCPWIVSGTLRFLGPHKLTQASTDETCVPLVNQGTHATVDIEVGTPGQKLSVVADTGSTTLVVASCVCQELGYCHENGSCFLGSKRSSTFNLSKTIFGQSQKMVLSFGSGSLAGYVAQEVVHLGSRSVRMKHGLVLMTESALNFNGPFEGILGLGNPKNPKIKSAPRKQSNMTSTSGSMGIDKFKQAMEKLKKALQPYAGAGGSNPFGGSNPYAATAPQPPAGLLEQGAIGRFSICLNEMTDGVLRLETPPVENAVDAIGSVHWAVGLYGISFGNRTSKVTIPSKLCSPNQTLKGQQQTPCGAIPDSGTTLITAPRAQILELLDEICELWPRCQQNHSAMVQAAKAAHKAAAAQYGFNPFTLNVQPKSMILQKLLLDCNSWINETVGLSELPTLIFQLGGRNGTKKDLPMPGHAYVIETKHSDARSLSSKIHNAGGTEQSSFGGAHVANLTANETAAGKDGQSAQKVCAPAFGVMEYNTLTNGPVWILGTPFFYQFNVHFDLVSDPPSVGFKSVEEEPCGTCRSSGSFVAGSSAERAVGVGWPRWQVGTPRQPSFDPEEGL